jgi:hypothetical protein
MFRSAGCSLWRAGGFFCYLEVLYEVLRIKIMQFFYPKIKKKTWIWIQIRIYKKPGSGSGSGFQDQQIIDGT